MPSYGGQGEPSHGAAIIAWRPLHRPRRRHPLPWVFNAEALIRPGMKDARRGKPGVDQLRDPVPCKAVLLTAPPKHSTPEVCPKCRNGAADLALIKDGVYNCIEGLTISVGGLPGADAGSAPQSEDSVVSASAGRPVIGQV